MVIMDITIYGDCLCILCHLFCQSARQCAFGYIVQRDSAILETVCFMGCSVAAWAMALIFMGGAGKSAMFPLHIWLPDAMEGPTPVSALIHAATMVVAGVYLVARLFPMYCAVPEVLELITWVGAITALYAAVVACVQTDIKRAQSAYAIF